jgi:hypothetical protein
MVSFSRWQRRFIRQKKAEFYNNDKYYLQHGEKLNLSGIYFGYWVIIKDDRLTLVSAKWKQLKFAAGDQLTLSQSPKRINLVTFSSNQHLEILEPVLGALKLSGMEVIQTS